MVMEKESKSLPEYETPSMVTYQAEDILEEILAIAHCSGEAGDREKPPGLYRIP